MIWMFVQAQKVVSCIKCIWDDFILILDRVLGYRLQYFGKFWMINIWLQWLKSKSYRNKQLHKRLITDWILLRYFHLKILSTYRQCRDYYGSPGMLVVVAIEAKLKPILYIFAIFVLLLHVLLGMYFTMHCWFYILCHCQRPLGSESTKLSGIIA